MMKKLREVLLVDDEEADSFYHRRVLQKLGCAERVTALAHGREAIEYLSTPVDGRLPRPDLVLVDINMPVLTGWEFLDAFEELPDEAKRGVKVFMVTTSTCDRDRDRALAREAVSGLRVKPLKRPAMLAILEGHFPDVYAAVC